MVLMLVIEVFMCGRIVASILEIFVDHAAFVVGWVVAATQSTGGMSIF